MGRARPVLGYLAIAVVCLGLAGAVYLHAQSLTAMAKHQYVEASSAEARTAAQNIGRSLEQIYESLRLLASLPAVRTIDRHGENLSEGGRTTIQHIYNNLASSVAVSEIYIVPATLDPERIDPVTGKPEEPVVMFDHMVLDPSLGLTREQRAAAPDNVMKRAEREPQEVETYEYRALRDQAQWLKQHYPRLSSFTGIDYPLLTSPEVITCDITEFVTTHDDADRKGVVLSVPFYDPQGVLRGMVSATILTNALRRLVGDSGYALVNPAIDFAVLKPGGSETAEQHALMRPAKPDPGLIHSEVLPLTLGNRLSQWSVWVGRPDGEFHNGPDARSIRTFMASGLIIAALLAIFSAAGWTLILRNMRNAARSDAALRAARDEAIQAENNAREMAELFKSMNEDVIRLNVQLAEKFRQLEKAQDQIIQQGRMRHIGELIGVVAHDLRNPLSAVRASSFIIAKRAAGSPLGLEEPLRRIDSAVSRCDAIIAQLLDFARPQPPVLEESEVDTWLVSVLEKKARDLPGNLDLRCELGLGKQTASFDAERMERAVGNLVQNAAEALQNSPAAPTRRPRIAVISRLAGRGIEISVNDNGPGILPDILENIHDPLTSTKGYGIGLGIPAVDQTVKQHGGGLEVESVAGEGASFTIWFPLGAAASSAA